MVAPNFQMPDKLQLDEASYTNTYGKFTLQPLEKGFGVTIGNAMRRVLLSTLPGTAITAIRLEGVLHEFSTIPGVVEDGTEIILNLKSVRMKPITKKLGKVELSVKGPKEITAADIQRATPEIEVLNPSLHIATLNSGASLSMEIYFGRGKGFVPSEENKKSDYPVGTIAIHSIFTPIKNVRFHIEQTRVGQQTDYEKLVLEVETDGSITADDAVVQAARILSEHIHLFIKFSSSSEAAEEIMETDSEFSRIRKILLMNIDDLELSVRSHNCLKAANIKTIGDLVSKDEPELLKFKNFGRKSLSELSEIIEGFGLNFGMDVDKYLKNSNN